MEPNDFAKNINLRLSVPVSALDVVGESNRLMTKNI